MQPKPNVMTAIAQLREQFPERVETGEAVRRQHANTLTWIANEPADAVVWPHNTEEVSRILRIAAEHRVPIIPFGAGTSLEGHVNAPCGGISLDMSRMDRVLWVNAADLDCKVEAGVTLRRLAEALRDTGLFFSVDPGAEEATLGGMAATRASGTRTVRYGTMRDNVLNLTAVMASGQIVTTGTRARKSAAGYDLTHLLVGSEGTLGVITELTLRLHPVPETIVAAVCPFASVPGACAATMTAVAAGLDLARIELLDATMIAAANRYSHLSLAETPTLFIELHGTPVSTREQIEALREIALAEGGMQFVWAQNESERRELWKARHDAFWALKANRPGTVAIATDVCVPISRLGACIEETIADIARSGLYAPILGHVGDGNFHTIPLVDANDREELARARAFIERLARRALTMEGTCTGEHGVGQGKIALLAEERGPGVDVLRQIKNAIDPLGILNPGKIFLSPPGSNSADY